MSLDEPEQRGGIDVTHQRNTRTGLAIGCAAVFLAACGAASQSQPSTAPPSAPPAAASVTAEDASSAPMPDAPASGVVLQLIAQQPPGKDVGWDVWELQAPAGKTFDVDYENTDDARHDFAVTPEDGLLSETIFKSEVVKPLAAAVITVPGLPAGTYDFICTLHSTEMRGTLTVR
jgi:plastocyanin